MDLHKLILISKSAPTITIGPEIPNGFISTIRRAELQYAVMHLGIKGIVKSSVSEYYYKTGVYWKDGNGEFASKQIETLLSRNVTEMAYQKAVVNEAFNILKS